MMSATEKKYKAIRGCPTCSGTKFKTAESPEELKAQNGCRLKCEQCSWTGFSLQLEKVKVEVK